MSAPLRTRTRIVPIGNSRGVRLPKPLLEQSGLSDEVELAVEKNRIVIEAASRPRRGWEQAFRAAADQGGDKLLDDDLTGRSEWDEAEWEW